jgi:hypothetical protein
MVCTRCGIIGADARPNWREQPARESPTGGQWRGAHENGTPARTSTTPSKEPGQRDSVTTELPEGRAGSPAIEAASAPRRASIPKKSNFLGARSRLRDARPRRPRGHAMRLPRRRILHLAAGVAALPAISRIARAQTYPTRPITMIVPFAAGGATDVIARLVAERMRGRIEQPIIIENVGGAEGSIGVGRAARARPDGYTLCVGTLGTHVQNGAFIRCPMTYFKGSCRLPRWPPFRLFFLYRRFKSEVQQCSIDSMAE